MAVSIERLNAEVHKSFRLMVARKGQRNYRLMYCHCSHVLNSFKGLNAYLWKPRIKTEWMGLKLHGSKDDNSNFHASSKKTC